MRLSPKEARELIIYRGSVKAGILRRIENGCEFIFSDEFLESSNYSGLSYRMLKSKVPLVLQGTNLHPFFAGLLPEGLRFKSLVRNLKTSDDDLFSLFAAAGSHVIGDVYSHSEYNNSSSIHAPPKLKEIDFYEYFQKILNSNSYSLGEDALAGVQEKISASMISFPLNIAKETRSYILKLNPKDKPRLVENELQCMLLAQRCGIDIPKIKQVTDKNQNLGLLIERFDRIWDESGNKFIMVHQEDGCQISNRYPADKYNLSFNEIAKNIAELATAPPAVLLKLLRLYSFSYLIGNGDLHAKNISLLSHHDRPLIDLTPAYDLISTFVYGDYKMAIRLDGKDDNITRKMIIEFGRRFQIHEKATSKMLDKLVKDIETHFDLLKVIPENEKALNHLERTVKKRITDLKVPN